MNVDTALHYVSISNGAMVRDGREVGSVYKDPAEMYRALGCNYSKFFKMDALCKWAWLAAEALLRDVDGNWLYEGLDKRAIAIAISTRDGCLDTDHRYAESMQRIASPALFVYTLPNIMLGEICIRHGFTGDQLCEVQDAFNIESSVFWARDLTARGVATHCLFGWADAVDNGEQVMLCWGDAESLQKVTMDQLQTLHNKALGRFK